jgi:toxin ParE1/3/4
VTHKVIVRPAAEEDIDEAAVWYERKRSGLGREFLVSVNATIEKIQQWPDLGVQVYKTLRRVRTPRFPYGVFYQIVHDKIIVVGVFHGSRSPRRWEWRLE